MGIKPGCFKSALPYLELACAVAAGGLWYTQGGAVWYAGAWPGPWPLILLAIPCLARLVIGGIPFRPGAMDIFLGLFLATAALGVWVANDPGPAWAKFWLVVGAVGLYHAMAHQPDELRLYGALAFWGVLGVALAAYFLATNDWAAYPAKAPILTALGRQISAWLPFLPGHRLHPNIVGGTLAMLMPVYVVLLNLARVRWARVVWGMAVGIAGLAVLISTSRGAWLALGGTAGLWMAWRGLGWWTGRRFPQPGRAWQARLLALSGLILIALPVVVILARQVLASPLAVSGVLANRLDLMTSSWLLARDYIFTGAGLGMYQMQFSIYTLLIHVGYITHSHNLFLDVLIEQGLGGLFALGGLAVAGLVLGVRRLRDAAGNAAWILEAAMAGLVVILAHGLVDDALYGSRGLLLLFVPLGMLAAASTQQAVVDRRQPMPFRLSSAFYFSLVALVALALALAIWWRPILGAWYANLGAVEQSRVELGHYSQWHFDNPTMDQVRRQNNLDAALMLLEQATQVDPANPTARQRLAAIFLSRGQYDQALAQVQAAWDAGQRDSVTCLLLGDAYAANGRPDQAVEVVRGLRWAEARLAGQAWARYWVSKDYQRAADAWAAVVALNPDNKQAAASQAEAARRAAEKH